MGQAIWDKCTPGTPETLLVTWAGERHLLQRWGLHRPVLLSPRKAVTLGQPQADCTRGDSPLSPPVPHHCLGDSLPLRRKNLGRPSSNVPPPVTPKACGHG